MIRRYRISASDIRVEGVDGMYTVKLYEDFHSLSNIIKEKLSQEDKEKIKDSVFVPVRVEIEDDMTVTMLFVAS